MNKSELMARYNIKNVSRKELEDIKKEKLNSLEKINQMSYVPSNDSGNLTTMINESINSVQVITNITNNKKEDLEVLVKTKQVGEGVVNEVEKMVGDLKLKEYNRLRNIFILDRNKRMEDGTLDSTISMNEKNALEKKAFENIKNDSKNKKILSFVQAKSVFGFDYLSDRSKDAKELAERNKCFMINEIGFSEASYDEYVKAKEVLVREKLKNPKKDGIISNPLKLQNPNNEFNVDPKTFSQMIQVSKEEDRTLRFEYLKLIPDFQKGTIYYTSEYLEALQEFKQQEDDVLQMNFSKGENDYIRETAKLVMIGQEMTKEDYTKKLILVDDSNKNIIQREPVVQDKIKRDYTIKDPIKEEIVEIKPEFKKKNVLDRFINKIPKTEEKEVVDSAYSAVISPLEVVEVIEMGNNPPLIENPLLKPKYDDFEEVVVENKTNVDIETTLDYLKTRNKKYNTSEYENIFKVVPNTKVDNIILRNKSNIKSRVNYIKECNSQRVSIYLPNSNIEVHVRKILDEIKLNHMLTLLSDIKDNFVIDYLTKFEMYKILYDVLQFDFQESVSFDEFMQCISIYDIPLLMTVLGMSFIPEEEDGTIPLSIDRVRCSNPIHIEQSTLCLYELSKPMIVDLKSEFKKNYPIDIYTRNYPLYKSKKYTSISDAYRDSDLSNSGKLFEITVQDVESKVYYKIFLSDNTIYKEYYANYSFKDIVFNKTLEYMKEHNSILLQEKGIEDAYKEFERMNNISFMRYFQDFGKANGDIIDKYNEYLNKSESEDEKILLFNYLDNISDEEKYIIDKYKKLVTFLEYVQVTGETLQEYLYMLQYIDIINVYLDEECTILVDSNISHDRVSDMYDVVFDFSENVISEIVTVVEKVIKKLDKYQTNIILNSNELIGLLKYENSFKSNEELISTTEMAYNRKLTEKEIEEIYESINLRVDSFNNKGICYCGNDKYVVDYLNILFFSMFKI